MATVNTEWTQSHELMRKTDFTFATAVQSNTRYHTED
jgi:hypothetical protein